jgi:hypothetical protein
MHLSMTCRSTRAQVACKKLSAAWLVEGLRRSVNRAGQAPEILTRRQRIRTEVGAANWRVSWSSFDHFFEASNVRRCWSATFAGHVKEISSSLSICIHLIGPLYDGSCNAADPGSHPHGAHPAIALTVKLLDSSSIQGASRRKLGFLYKHVFFAATGFISQ